MTLAILRTRLTLAPAVVHPEYSHGTSNHDEKASTDGVVAKARTGVVLVHESRAGAVFSLAGYDKVALSFARSFAGQIHF